MPRWSRRQPALELIAAAKGEASWPGRCAKTRQRCARELESSGAMVVMNFASQSSLSAAEQREGKREKTGDVVFKRRGSARAGNSICLRLPPQLRATH